MPQNGYYWFKYWYACFFASIYGKTVIKLCFQKCSPSLLSKASLYLFTGYTYYFFIVRNSKIRKWS